MKTQFLDIREISSMCANENTIALEFIDYDDVSYVIEIRTEEVLTSFNNEFMNYAADTLHKYIKKQINESESS